MELLFRKEGMRFLPKQCTRLSLRSLVRTGRTQGRPMGAQVRIEADRE